MATSAAPNHVFLPAARRRLISSPDTGRGELLLFRLVERLSVGRAGCVLNFAKLAEMLGKCKRQTWTLFGRLVKSGWVAYRVYRKRGKSYFEFWPVVRVSERSEPVFQQRTRLIQDPSEASFSAAKTALSTALSTPENCTLVEGAYKTLLTPKGGGRQTAHCEQGEPDESETLAVAVSLLENIVSPHEAQELAREATKKQLSKEQIGQVIASYQSQIAKIYNRGAWLRRALQRGYQPPAAPATHPSEISGLAVAKKVKVRFDQPNQPENAMLNNPQTGGYEAALKNLPFQLKRKKVTS